MTLFGFEVKSWEESIVVRLRMVSKSSARRMHE